MKKLKIWSIMMLMVMAMPLMVACGGGDDDGSDKYGGSHYGNSWEEFLTYMSGTWICTESTDIQDGNRTEGLMVGKEVTIKRDGTFTSTASSFGYSGTYTQTKGNEITAKSSAGTFVINVSGNGDWMKWSGSSSNGVSFEYSFKRKV